MRARARGVLYCKTCGFEGKVRGSPLNPKGTKAGAFKSRITELEEKVHDLNVKLTEIPRQINAGKRKEQELERRIREKDKTCEKLNKAIATLSAETEEKRRECMAEHRRSEKLKKENDVEEEKRRNVGALLTCLLSEEIATGEQIEYVVYALNRALKLQRGGKLGSAQKPMAEVRSRVVKLMEKATGKKYLTWEEHEQDVERRLETQRLKHEKTVKEVENEVLPIKEIWNDVVELNERLEGVVSTQRERIEQLEEELFETRERIAALEEKPSIGLRSQPQPTLRLKLLKRGVS